MNQKQKSNQSKRYDEEFKRSAVELIVHSGRPLSQVARELGVSEYSLHLWRKRYLGQMPAAQVEGKPMSAEEMAKEIRRQHKEIEYLKRQREILKKAMSILGEDPTLGMR